MSTPSTDTVITEAFDRLWEGWSDLDPTEQLLKHRPLHRMIDRLVPPGGRILEVGSGTGIDAHHLRARGYRVVALDLSAPALALSRRIAGAFPHTVDFVQGDMFNLPHPDGTFDLVYSQGLLEHFDDPSGAVREQVRVVRPGGLLLVDVPQRFHVYTLAKHALIRRGRWQFGWETEYDQRRLRALIEPAGVDLVAMAGSDMLTLEVALKARELALERWPWMRRWDPRLVRLTERAYDAINARFGEGLGRYRMLNLMGVWRRPGDAAARDRARAQHPARNRARNVVGLSSRTGQ